MIKLKFGSQLSSRRKREAGLTIFETLTSMALLGFMTLVLFGFMKLSRLIFDQDMTHAQAQGYLKRTIEVMARDLREARKGVAGSCPDVNNPQYVCATTTILSFKVPEKAAEDGSVIYKTVKYQFNGMQKTVRRIEIPSTGPSTSPFKNQVIGRHISGVSFLADATNDTVNVTLTSDQGSSLSTQAFLRN